MPSAVTSSASRPTSPALASCSSCCTPPRTARRAEASLSGACPLFRNFVDLLFDKNREGVLVGLGEAFRSRLFEASGVVEGVVSSARPLGSGELAELTVSLGARLGKEVRLKNEIDPSLIAGIRVIVDSRMVDCSVVGRFEGLRRRLLEAPLPAGH